MRIDASGNVGVGTATAGGKLNVQGFNSYRGDAYTVASFAASSTLAPLNIVQNNNGTYPGIAAGQNSSAAFQPLAFFTSDTERMTISATGTVSIGTTVSANALQVAGGAVQCTSIGNIGQFEMVGGSASTWYNSGFRNDGNSAYFLVSAVQATQTAAISAGFSSARPWFVNLVNGAMTVGPPSTAGSALTVTGLSGANVATLYVSGANTGGLETVRIADTSNSNGALVYLLGNGATNPGKFLRAYNGTAQWINNAYTSVIWQMDDAGGITQYSDAAFAGSYGPTSTLSIGYRGLPQNSPGTNYTGVLSDAGKSIIMGNALTFTIPANSSVAYPIGTTLTIINSATGAGQNCTIAITTDTLYQANTSGATGSRGLAPLGIATAIKITSTGWLISGFGLF